MRLWLLGCGRPMRLQVSLYSVAVVHHMLMSNGVIAQWQLSLSPAGSQSAVSVFETYIIMP